LTIKPCASSRKLDQTGEGKRLGSGGDTVNSNGNSLNGINEGGAGRPSSSQRKMGFTCTPLKKGSQKNGDTKGDQKWKSHSRGRIEDKWIRRTTNGNNIPKPHHR